MKYLKYNNIKSRIALLLITCIVVLIAQTSSAQVKIGNNSKQINKSSILELEHPNKALLLTRVANVGEVINPVDGVIVYDMEKQCVRAYHNGKWSLGFGLGGLKPSMEMNCADKIINPAFASQGVFFQGSLSIPYTNGNGANCKVKEYQSTGVEGLTATLKEDILNIGDGTIEFVISGTPEQTGSAKFIIDFGGGNSIIVLEVR